MVDCAVGRYVTPPQGHSFFMDKIFKEGLEEERREGRVLVVNLIGSFEQVNFLV